MINPIASAEEIFVRFCGISGGLNQLGEGELVTLGVKDAVDVAEGVEADEVVDEAEADCVEDIVTVPVAEDEDVAVAVADAEEVAEEEDEDVADAEEEDEDVADAEDEEVSVIVDVCVEDAEGVTVSVGPAVAVGYADIEAEAELVLEAVDVGLGVIGTDMIVIR